MSRYIHNRVYYPKTGKVDRITLLKLPGQNLALRWIRVRDAAKRAGFPYFAARTASAWAIWDVDAPRAAPHIKHTTLAGAEMWLLHKGKRSA